MADIHAATELKLYIDNDGDLYRRQTTSILKNLATKRARGEYKHDLAVKAFGYLTEAGAKKYAGEFGSSDQAWHKMFDAGTRKQAAEALTRDFEAEAALGNYDHLLPKKYQGQKSGAPHGWRKASGVQHARKKGAPTPKDVRAIRGLARQDHSGESDDSYARTGDAEDTIRRWYAAGGSAGDRDLIDLIDRVGVREAARVYAAARVSGGTGHARKKFASRQGAPRREAPRMQHATKKLQWKTPESIKVVWSPVNQAFFALWPGHGLIKNQSVLKIANADEMHGWLRDTYGEPYGLANRGAKATRGRGATAHARKKSASSRGGSVSGQDIREFRGFLGGASDSQVQGIYEKEQRAGREEYAELAVAEADRRGISLDGHYNHARRTSPAQLNREIAAVLGTRRYRA